MRYLSSDKYIERYILLLLLCLVALLNQGCSNRSKNNAMSDYDRQIADLKRNSSADSPYIENGSFATDMEQIYGIAVDNKDNIFVVGDHTIQPYTPTGIPKSAILSEHTGYAVAVDSENLVYVATQDAVHVYEPLGMRKAVWESRGVNARLTSISINGQDVYVADAGNKVVLHYDLEGRLLETIGKGTFIVPSRHLDVFADSEGKAWIVNPGKHTLSLYQNGKTTKTWGKTSASKDGFSGCCNPTDFAITKDGHFVTAEKGIVRVKMYDPDGNFECIVAGPELFGHSIENLELATDSRGRILILDPEKRSVRIFERRSKA